MQRILDIGLFYICLSQWLFGNDKLNIRQRSWSVADLTRAITQAIEIKESNQISSDQIRQKVVEFSLKSHTPSPLDTPAPTTIGTTTSTHTLDTDSTTAIGLLRLTQRLRLR